MSECEACGNEPPQTVSEHIDNISAKIMDAIKFGVRYECSECGSRLKASEILMKLDEEQTDELKFLEEESLTYGME